MMNGRDGGSGGGFRAPRKISNCFKDRDEELSFFRDLKKHEKDQLGSLLQPVSEEFEANGNNGLYRMDSGGRKGMGLGFLAETGKNDYNWLKTPPATPLFPSLEMETHGQELVVQREIPIIHPLSRFSGSSNGHKTSSTPPKPNPNPKLPQRQKTPMGRPSVSDKKNMKTAPLTTDKPKPGQPNFPPSKALPKPEPKPIARGVSPLARPKITGLSETTPSNLRTTSRPASATRGRPITVLSETTPPNLRITSRPASATRGRPAIQNLPIPAPQQETEPKIRRQSCSPSVARGRKADANVVDRTSANRGQVLGSRMVDRFMNARSSNGEDRKAKIKPNGSMNEGSRVSNGEGKIKLNGSLNESSGFGRLMSKSSLDMALKHMEFQREAGNGRKHGAIHGRKS